MLNNIELTRFFFAIVLLLSMANIFGYIFQKLKLTRVAGEILGGILLGPTLLGAIFPEIYIWTFQAFPAEGQLLSIMYWFGLVFLMFISGYEIKRLFDGEDKGLVSVLILGSTIIPFLAGWLAVDAFNLTYFIGSQNNIVAFKIVIGIAVAVTSIPVISKIFIDLDIIRSRFAKVVLSTSTIHDLILWVALAIATGIIGNGKVSWINIGGIIMATLGLFALGLMAMPKILNAGNKLRINVLFKSSVTGYALFICFLFSATASLLNVNIVFGAFLAGIVISSMPEDIFAKVKNQIREISMAFFIPIYFALVGLKLDLLHSFNVLFFAAFLLFAVFAQGVGTMLAARLAHKDWLSSFNLSVAMNARGGPGIVLASVAYETGIINVNMFVVLIMMTIATSLMAAWWFQYILTKGWPLLKQ